MKRSAVANPGPLSVEVVVCTYNGEKFLPAQLESIARQTRAVDRISIYDDQSTDTSVAIAESFAVRFAEIGTQVHIVRNERNLGYAQNFSSALTQAQADIVFFCDQDDIWEAHKVEHLSAAFDNDSCVLAFSDGSLIDAGGAPIHGPSVLESYGVTYALTRAFSRQAWPTLLRRNYVNGAAMAVRRLPALTALPIPKDFPHDYWLALWLAKEAAVTCVPETLYRYRQHGHNAIGIGTMKRTHQFAAIWRNPRPPRRMDLQRVSLLLDRLPHEDPRYSTLQAKQQWLQSVAGERGRWARLASICVAILRGDYARFAPPYALARDVTAALRGI